MLIYYLNLVPLILHLSMASDVTRVGQQPRLSLSYVPNQANGNSQPAVLISVTLTRFLLDHSHRLRLVSTSCFPRQAISQYYSVDHTLTFGNSYTFSIDGHSLTIIEADGVETQPLTVDSLNIFAAQRYSVVVTMNQPVDNYCKERKRLLLSQISLIDWVRDPSCPFFRDDGLYKWYQLRHPSL